MSKFVGDSAVYSNLLRDTGQAALQRGVRYSIPKCDGQCPFMLALYKCALLRYFVLCPSEPKKVNSHGSSVLRFSAGCLKKYTLQKEKSSRNILNRTVPSADPWGTPLVSSH